MMGLWNKPIVLKNTFQLYDLQGPISHMLISMNVEIHIVEHQHKCSLDMLGFVNNRMGAYKCIQIPNGMKHGDLTFATIMKNCTRKKIHFFLPSVRSFIVPDFKYVIYIS